MMDEKNTKVTAAVPSAKERSDSKKYVFYRKPSIKKKAPEVKQTLTSYKRMLKANPLLKNEMEGKDLSILSRPLQNSKNIPSNIDNTGRNVLSGEKQSLQPNFNAGKPLVAKVQRSQSLKRTDAKSTLRVTKKVESTIISGSKKLIGRTEGRTTTSYSTNISRQSNVDFNTSTSRFLCSTRLESCSKVQTTNSTATDSNNKAVLSNKVKSLTQDNSVSSSNNPTLLNTRDKPKKKMRRSLSAQHFERKNGGAVKVKQQNKSNRVELTKSLDDFSKLKHTSIPQDPSQNISPIAEGSQESSMIFKTPSAYERRSIAKFTPKSVLSTRRSLYRPATPLPSLNDLQKRLNDWLMKRGKRLSSFHHLKYFVIQEKTETIDEENKENIEVDQDLDKGSYEDLRIDKENLDKSSESENNKSVTLNEENIQIITKAALEDLHKLIQDGYPGPQCEGWLQLIRQKYQKLEEEPLYWECRAAIEQSRGNISNAVQCYRTAIVQGAEIESVDESLDNLLQKFSLLNISTKDVDNEKSVKERARIVRDARNVFKSSIIQFAVQERKLKKNGNVIDDDKKYIAIPVRRSTRLSRSAYTSTPGVKLCSSLQELDTSDREMLDFQTNKALL